MANSLNRVMLMGNLTRDIELRAVGGSGQQVAKLGLALNRSFTTASGEKREEVTFVDCEAWGKTAEIMHKYLGKGRQVCVEGRLKLDTWDDKDSGKKQSKLKVVVESFYFADSKGGSGGGGAGGPSYSEEDSQPQVNTRPANRAAPSAAPMGDDDIPF
ncbi:MAG: single-stranded DNA-binding protein [Phycisphaeraceae bacterium]|nr:single-stranded DNA-binding protein [Phycisphaeraceae bacterium]